MKKTVQVAAIATALSGMVISPLFASAEGEANNNKSVNYGSEGVVGFKSNDGGDPTPPVDPTNPDPGEPVKPVDPIDPTDPGKPGTGTSGPLSLDFASSLNFGTNNKITANDVTYYANAQKIIGKDNKEKYVPNYVQITDNRGKNAGWTLTVKQEGQLSYFTNAEKTDKKELKGAEIKFSDPKVSGQTGTDAVAPTATAIKLDPYGAESVVMSAEEGKGAGLWVNLWGKTEEMTDDEGNKVQKNKAVTLTVPGSTLKDAKQYSTKLTWNLSDVPGNNKE